MTQENRIVEPVEGWQRFHARNWGAGTAFIEDWFDAGEALKDSPQEVEIDEPDHFERALSWLRSVFIALRTRPA